jgi:hypothetical protein
MVERLALPGAFADMLFALKPGEVTQPVETPMGWFIGTVSEKKAPEQKPLESVKKEIAGQLFVKEKAKALAQVEADKALAAVKAGKTLAELFPAEKAETNNPFGFAAETKPEAKESGELKASDENMGQLGTDAGLKKTIFELKAAGLVDRVVTAGDALLLVNVTERTLPNDEDFARRKAELTVEAVKGKQFEVREAFLKALKQTGTVVTFDAAIEKVIGDS